MLNLIQDVKRDHAKEFVKTQTGEMIINGLKKANDEGNKLLIDHYQKMRKRELVRYMLLY